MLTFVLDKWITGLNRSVLIFFTYFNVYFWERERERESQRQRQSMNRGGAEREGNTESERGSRLWAVSTEPDTGLQPGTARS